MRYILCGLAAATLIGGCSGGSDEGVEPGEWEFSVSATGFEAPEAPEATRQAMQSSMESTAAQTMTQCITPEQARNLDTDLGTLSGNDNCEITESVFEGGTIRVRGTCAIPGAPEPAEMRMDGTYDRTSMSMDIDMDMTVPQLGPVTTQARMEAEHKGECEA
ncbi:MAG: DUF3617 domain-containing protein [Parasphingopyxis sp.]|nr:DUF3617 domain-containing protein [Sphingomonadales bacterium]